MKRVLGVGTVALLAATALFAATAKQMPDKVTIDDCKVKRAPVEFNHKMHAEANECKTCHHTQADLKAGADVEVQSCGSCHLNPEKAETPKCTEMGMTKNPFHTLCVDCHKDTVKADATKKAPTKCDDCHPKG